MSETSFQGTVAIVRRAVERNFVALEPGDAVWRGRAGPGGAEVRVDVDEFSPGRAAVDVSSRIVESAELTPLLARAILIENQELLLGRLRHHDGAVNVELTVLGGFTLDPQEVRIAVWAVGWAADALAPRFAHRLAGGPPASAPPVPEVEPRRGAAQRIQSTQERVQRFLAARFGSFEHDENWGYHGGFGSTRVFCLVRHYLETSTVVIVGSPVLSDIDLSDGLALDAHEIGSRGPLGRFAYLEDRRELWFAHAILGDDLDPDELETAINAVAEVADAEDDRLQGAYGGRRYADLFG